MPLTCNINSRGKVARLIYGLVFILLGILLAALWAHGSGSLLRWAVAVVCVLSGAFAVFEARAGWCVIRAMGLKTPL